MNTYLLTWNPRKFAWEDLSELAQEVRAYGSASDRWSCGKTKKMRPGDRFFMLRQGKEPRGIIGSGHIASWPFEDKHWDEENASPSTYVDIEFDVLLDPGMDNILARNTLSEQRFSGTYWDPQSSGTQIISHVAEEVEKTWVEVLESNALISPTARPVQLSLATNHSPSGSVVVRTDEPLYEGQKRTITFQKAERSVKARRICLEHYGTNCSVCDFDFGMTYGPIGEDVIHVHHLKPISQNVGEYEIDPIKDLRPVCPNCHIMLHKRTPKPFSIKELKDMMKKAQASADSSG